MDIPKPPPTYQKLYILSCILFFIIPALPHKFGLPNTFGNVCFFDDGMRCHWHHDIILNLMHGTFAWCCNWLGCRLFGNFLTIN